jgi:hypothetical protein
MENDYWQPNVMVVLVEVLMDLPNAQSVVFIVEIST